MLRINWTKLTNRTEIDNNHVWGYQVRMVNTDEYCGKFMVLTNECPGSYHWHVDKKETFVVLAGRVEVLIEGVRYEYQVGDSVTIEREQKHSMKAIETPAIVLEVSTHDEDSDTYRR